jgi:hypothetical protein
VVKEADKIIEYYVEPAKVEVKFAHTAQIKEAAVSTVGIGFKPYESKYKPYTGYVGESSFVSATYATSDVKKLEAAFAETKVTSEAKMMSPSHYEPIPLLVTMTSPKKIDTVTKEFSAVSNESKRVSSMTSSAKKEESVVSTGESTKLEMVNATSAILSKPYEPIIRFEASSSKYHY